MLIYKNYYGIKVKLKLNAVKKVIKARGIVNRVSLIIKQKMISIIFVIIAVIGGIIIFWYISSLKAKIPENIDYNLTFVARTDIKEGEEITEELIEEQKIPENMFGGKSIINEDEIIGQKVTVDITKGEIITKDKLGGMDSGSGFNLSFSSYIPYDLRAVSIPVSFYGDKSLLKEGDSVDLISTYYDQESGSLYSETVFSEKEIILVGSIQGESQSGDENDSGDFLLDTVITGSSDNSGSGDLLILTFYLSKPEVDKVFLALERGVLNLSICPQN